MKKVISRAEYSNMVDFIKQCPPRTPLRRLKEKFPEIEEMTLWSIDNVLYSKKMRKHTVMLKAEHKFLRNIYYPYRAALAKGEHAALLKIADKMDIAPALVAKRVLEYEHLRSDPHNQADSPRTSAATNLSHEHASSEHVDLNAVQRAAELDMAKHTGADNSNIQNSTKSNIVNPVVEGGDNFTSLKNCSSVTSLAALNWHALLYKVHLHWTFSQEMVEGDEHHTALLLVADKCPSPQLKGHGTTQLTARRDAAFQALAYLGLLDPKSGDYIKMADKNKSVNFVERGAAEEVVTAGLDRLAVSSASQPSSTASSQSKLVGKKVISLWMKEPHRIPDKQLANEVSICVTCDTQFGPIAQAHHTNLGSQYEYKLIQEADKYQLRYEDENVLRARGFDKTPDIKLDVPIAVGDQIVNWIESKALFGDELTHERYLNEQLWSYWNRFGAGLVIYWFGYIEEMADDAAQGILISDTFPSNFVTL